MLARIDFALPGTCSSASLALFQHREKCVLDPCGQCDMLLGLSELRALAAHGRYDLGVVCAVPGCCPAQRTQLLAALHHASLCRDPGCAQTWCTEFQALFAHVCDCPAPAKCLDCFRYSKLMFWHEYKFHVTYGFPAAECAVCMESLMR